MSMVTSGALLSAVMTLIQNQEIMENWEVIKTLFIVTLADRRELIKSEFVLFCSLETRSCLCFQENKICI